MPKAPTAVLMNGRYLVTQHECVRLERRGEGCQKAIYPIYRCTETGSERVCGRLGPRTSKRELAKLFPGVELTDCTDDDQAEAAAEFAA